MIKYGQFQFASPPRTGTTWFLKAAFAAGLKQGSKSAVHVPPPPDYKGFVVTIIRHPYNWLMSYYATIKGGKIGVPEVDKFANIVKKSEDFESFVLKYISECPGQIGKMFDSYQASTVMRLEDIPWAAIEFFSSLRGTLRLNEAQAVLPQNIGKQLIVVTRKRLRRKVVAAEKEFCERYEYGY